MKWNEFYVAQHNTINKHKTKSRQQRYIFIWKAFERSIQIPMRCHQAATIHRVNSDSVFVFSFFLHLISWRTSLLFHIAKNFIDKHDEKSLINEIDIDSRAELLSKAFFPFMDFSSFSLLAISATTMDTRRYCEINVIRFWYLAICEQNSEILFPVVWRWGEMVKRRVW